MDVTLEKTYEFIHNPVLKNEVIEYLKLEKGDKILDATVGSAGHAELILKNITPGGLLIGIDKDVEALELAKRRLNHYNSDSCKLIHGKFENLDAIFRKINIGRIDGALFDLGVSSLQLDSPERGFSIMHNGPLDMRMDLSDELTAWRVVNKYSQEKLQKIIKDYGEERYAKRIARSIVNMREKTPFKTTEDLRNCVSRAVLFQSRRHSRLHAATRTFQAIRIEVNQELAALMTVIESLPQFLNHGARVVIISFHSLEDRIVKNYFRRFSKEGTVKLINKKPITASPSEIDMNPRSRSAKMRVGEYIR